MSDRPCTCHPDDNPPVPCPQKFALSECRAAAPSIWKLVPAEPTMGMYDDWNAARKNGPSSEFFGTWEAAYKAMLAAAPAAPAPCIGNDLSCPCQDGDACHYKDSGKTKAWPTAPAEPVALGDYVLATKWSDGDPGDHWGVGFYDGERNGRHYVIDGKGEQIRGNGFRRVGRIKPEIGKWLLDAASALEASPPGAINLWNVIASNAYSAVPAPDALDAARYRFLKTLSGQVLFIQIIRNKGADYLDAAVDEEMKDQP